MTLTAEAMAPLMFAGMFIFLLFGYPVTFSLAALGLGFGVLGVHMGFFAPEFLANLPLRIFGILSNDLLLAIPFFTFMGALLERCGLAEDLLESMGQMFGGLPGGLGYAVIIVGAVLGAITGTVAGSVIAMGVIALPTMLRYGYDARIATGVIAASGTITQLIPPSLVLIVLADQLGRSVGDMYAGAIGPSIVQTLLFLAFMWAVSVLSPARVPPLPPEARTLRGWALWSRVLWGIVPSLGLMFLVLGTIFMGVATPTEAGAMGVMGALLLAGVRGRLTWLLVWQGMESTMRITAMVIFILFGASVFSLVFQGFDGGLLIEHLLSDLPGGRTGFLVMTMVAVFFLAFFLDFFEIAFIVVPLLAPVAQKLGIDLVWFGVLLCVNLQTSYMHPPFGYALFYLRGVAPKEVKSKDIYMGAIPWVGLQVLMIGLVIAFPNQITYFLDKTEVIDTDKVKIELEAPMGTPGAVGSQEDLQKQFERSSTPGAKK